ncbi:MAG: DNA mismatch repair protein MutS, partial [Candidatus Latescibacterota bacterium]
MTEPATPMMRQYRSMKELHPDAILFFRMGDFYEMFHEDAELASRLLGLTLTSRSKGEEKPIPLAGIPWHKSEPYIERLIRLGYKVAVCDQTEDPKHAKGLVRREVTEVITPGTALGGGFLEGKQPNYLIALAPPGAEKQAPWGIAAIDLSTGDFRIGDLAADEVAEEVARFEPAEILLPENGRAALPFEAGGGRGPAVTEREAWRFDAEAGERTLQEHFGA